MDGDGNVPLCAGVADFGINIEGSEPVVSRRQTGELGAAVHVGLGLCGEVARLREIKSHGAYRGAARFDDIHPARAGVDGN